MAGTSKLTDQQVLEIRLRAKEGVTARQMAQELRVNVETIRRIVRRESHQLVGLADKMPMDVAES